MSDAYDEDLSRNAFFVELRDKYGDLLMQIVANGWIVCVPRIGALRALLETPIEDRMRDHVLMPDDELPGHQYFTLSGVRLVINGKLITVQSGNDPLHVRILFEEIFYTEDNLKYKVWCVECPLNADATYKTETPPYRVLSSLRDCIDFLWTETGGKQILEDIDIIVRKFKGSKFDLEAIDLDIVTESINELFAKSLELALINRKLKLDSEICPNYKHNVELSVETYVHYRTYNELFELLAVHSAGDDSNLNKIIRNLSDVELKDLEIGGEFIDCIPNAKMCLSQIVKHKTIVDKVICVKNTVESINRKSEGSVDYLSTDELLPIVIFLVIKSGIANWYAQLNFMKRFRFSAKSLKLDEASFLISTLEAAIEHLKLGIHVNLNGNSETETVCANYRYLGKLDRNNRLHYLFKQIVSSNFNRVKEILANPLVEILDDNLTNGHINGEHANGELCHPLCTCQKCVQFGNVNPAKVSTALTVHSRDLRGLNVLHVASVYNRPKMIDYFIESKADIDAIDHNGYTALHYAAQRGHQNAILLLLHAGADVNRVNFDKNTPLHLASNNGHDSCVKAIIYYTENCRIVINPNIQNDNGESALHLASKWGFVSIAQILLEYGANPWLQDNNGKCSIDVAHSGRILKLLQSSGIDEFINVVNVNKHITKIIDFSNRRPSVTFLNLSRIPSVKITNLTEETKQLEKLFRAILYGDVKLACFYMGMELTDRNEPSINCECCHPLCTCEHCETATNPTPKIDINTCDINGNTSLHIATKYGHLEIVAVLLKNNAATNVQNQFGQTPLHIAALERRHKIAKAIIDRGTNINVKDADGNTPLHLACISGSIEIVHILLNKDAVVHTMNSRGRTPLDEAKERTFLTIIALFEKI